MKRPWLSIETRLPDFDRDGDLADRLAELREFLAACDDEFAAVFWKHYESTQGLAGRWTEAQIAKLQSRTARYFCLRNTEPLTQTWTDDALELANSAYDAGISITVVLAALGSVHRQIRRRIVSAYSRNADKLLDALDAAERLNILESEILTTQIHQLHEQGVAAERRELIDRFDGEIGAVVQTLLGKAAKSQQAAKALQGSLQAMRELSSALRQDLTDHSANVLAVSSATSQLVRSLAAIRDEVTNIKRAIGSSVSAMTISDEFFANLSNQSAKAFGIIKIVKDLLENSEILSLNAQIEASRGGSVDNAFGAIAGEMRELVSQTRTAIATINDLVTGMRTATEKVLESASQIRASVSETQTATEGLSMMANDQERALDDVHLRMKGVSKIAESVSQGFTTLDEQVSLIATATAELSGAIESSSTTAADLEKAGANFVSEIAS